MAVLGRRDGPYHRAWAAADASGARLGIRHWRADQGHSPVFDAADVVVTADASKTGPCLAIDTRGRMICSCVDDGAGGNAAGGYEMTSDSDGDTWGAASMSIPNARHMRVRAGKDGGLMRLALVPDGMGHSPATYSVQTQYQAPGDPSPSALVTLTDQAGTPISAADTPPDLDHAAAGSSPWRLCLIEAGQSTPTEFTCTHETAPAWQRIS